jgi:ABC-2 type transport system permease protein
MRDLIRSEFRKIRTTRTVYGLLAGAVALVVLAAIGTVHDSAIADLSGPLHTAVFMNVLPFVLPVFLLSLGIRAFTEEFQYGSIVPTLLASPDRRRVLVAKLVVMTGAAVVFVAVTGGVSIGLGTVLATMKGATITVAAAPLAATIGKLLGLAALFGGIGLGVGLVVKHQVAAAVGSLIWLFVGEQLIGALTPGVARFLPGHAANGVFATDPGLLAPLAAAVVLVGWATAALIAGATVMDRRDIA